MDMDLNSITSPSFIKDLSHGELLLLSEDIRSFLIEKLSVTGGHIGPNLGVVELTVALHSAFNSPNDKFIWDVGHQSYVHKILTGRANQFDTLRQYKGLCGFPKRMKVNMMFGKQDIARLHYLQQWEWRLQEILKMNELLYRSYYWGRRFNRRNGIRSIESYWP